MLTGGFRRNFARSQRRHAALQQDLKTLKSFTFLLEEKPASVAFHYRSAADEDAAE